MEENLMQNCYNCEATLPSSAKYCPACGQKKLDNPIRGLWPFLRESFQETFNINSTLFTTPLQLFIPAQLTLAFTQGKRKKYASPIRLFLMMGLVFLFVLNRQLKKEGVFKKIIHDHELTIQETGKQLLIDEMRTSPTLFNHDSTIIYNVLDSMETLIDSNSFAKDTMDFINRKIPQSDLLFLEKDSIIKKHKIDKLIFIQRVMFEKYIDAQKDGKGLASHMIGSIIWLILAMLPFFALIMGFLYIQHNRYYLEHFIFGIHLHTFYFFLAIILVLVQEYLSQGSGKYILLPLLSISTIYTYIAMKRFYKQSYFKIFWKMIVLAFLYIFAALIILFWGLFISAALF